MRKDGQEDRLDEAINLAKEFGSLCMQWCLANGVKEEDINMEIDPSWVCSFNCVNGLNVH